MSAGVTSPTIRKRILKQTDHHRGIPGTCCYIAYDPQEDTETLVPIGNAAYLGCVTSPTIRKRILKRRQGIGIRLITAALHRLRSARGY